MTSESGNRAGAELPREGDVVTRIFRPSMLWQPNRVAASAWLEHVPFAFWLVDILRPKRVVELGTHRGVSYSAICQAVKNLGLAASCFAVDTWQGDEQTGFYDEVVFDEFREFHDRLYGGFSRLVRSTFDEALNHFADRTIDLLHIDGRHTYEAVRHDFESWQPKLSENCVVLFHDTNVRENDFGVFQFWDELKQGGLQFEFLHCHGLGVFGSGREYPAELQLLFHANVSACASVRENFRSLGRSVRVMLDEILLRENMAARAGEIGSLRENIMAYENKVSNLHECLREKDAYIGSLNSEVSLRAAESGELRQRLSAVEEDLAHRDDSLAAHDEMIASLTRKLESRSTEVEELQHQLTLAEDTLADLGEKLAEKQKAVSSLESELAAQSDQIAEVCKRATASDARLVALESEHAARKEDLSRREMEASSLQEGIATRDREIGVLRWNVAEKNAKIDHLDSIVRSLYGSTSWRITAPMRALRQGFKKAAPAVAPLSTPKAAFVARSSPEEGLSGFRLVYVSSEWYSAGHDYRVIHFIDAARLIGIEASWIKLNEVPERLDELSRAHAIVFWRIAWSDDVEMAVAAARGVGAHVIFDVDDLMIEPELARESIIDGIRTQGFTEDQVRTHYSLVRRMMLEADICTTTTNEIASYMRLAGKPTFVVPNGFDRATLSASRLAVRHRHRRRTADDGLIRIGYASGTRTHQRDFAVAAKAIAGVLRERPQCRLVLFRDDRAPLVDVSEYGELAPFEAQIEWRAFVPREALPEEIARFDINIAPLETGNPYCEVKSELKYFEAALVDVVTVASPTGPFRRALRDGETGALAAEETAWYKTLLDLIDDPVLRRNLARNARYDAMRQFGTIRRTNLLANFVAQLRGGREAASAFELQSRRDDAPAVQLPQIPDAEVVFESDDCRPSQVTVIMPLFNYAHYVLEALESVRKQTLKDLDLVIVDDCSADDSVAVALEWVKRNVGRFHRLLLLRNRHNAGLGLCRNVAFDATETPYVLPLDPDNRLRPACCERLLDALDGTDASFAYPVIQQFEAASALMGVLPFEPQRFVSGNYIDAMALVSKEAWVYVGGYVNMWGWEDYDFWCGLIEQGLRGKGVGEVLAEYRVHDSSMLRTMTERPENKRILLETIGRRHTWLCLVDGRGMAEGRPAPGAKPKARCPEMTALRKSEAAADRLEYLLPYLRCPETGEVLERGDDGFLHTPDGRRRWPIVEGRPILYPGMAQPEIKAASHISNALPDAAMQIIRQAGGLVLNLSAGGTTERYDHVIEAEAAIFRHTDTVVDAHHLPFGEATFEAVIALNAFEHYRDPSRVAREILRILRPDGRVFIHTAFLQPLHEPPWHFYNCTRYGLETWFEGFDCEEIRVSDNFAPSYSISWLASECEVALRRDVSAEAAEAFLAAPVGLFSRFWREPESRNDRRWTDFGRLSQKSQEVIGAGFQFLGRKPGAR